MSSNWVRLAVSASSTSKAGLIQALEDKARAFFGDEDFRLERDIDAEPEVEVTHMSGTVGITSWTGTAHFVNYRDPA